MKLIEYIHEKYVHDRRVRVLSKHLCELIPEGARVLDVGCGDGHLASLISECRRDLSLSGIDVLARQNPRIPITTFDGKKIPFADKSVDVVMFVDVLHHTEDPIILLREAMRVTRKAIVIKDHTLNGLLAETTLRFMDHVSNARKGIALPYNFWPREEWLKSLKMLKLEVKRWESDLRLYPIPADWVFGRSLHFISRLEIDQT